MTSQHMTHRCPLTTGAVQVLLLLVLCAASVGTEVEAIMASTEPFATFETNDDACDDGDPCTVDRSPRPASGHGPTREGHAVSAVPFTRVAS